MASFETGTAFASSQAAITSGGSRQITGVPGGSGADRIMQIWVIWYRNTNRLLDVSVEYNGVAATPLDSATEVGVNEMFVKSFELIGPASGPNMLEVFAASWGGGGSSTDCYVITMVAQDAAQASNAARFVIATGGPYTGPPVAGAVTVPSETDALVAALAIMDSTDVSYSAATITNGDDRLQQLNVFNSGIRVALITAAGAASVTPTATWSTGVGGAVTSYFRALGISILNVGGGGGSTVDLLAAPVSASARLRGATAASALALAGAALRASARVAPAIAASATAVRPAPTRAALRLRPATAATAIAVLASPVREAPRLMPARAASAIALGAAPTRSVVRLTPPTLQFIIALAAAAAPIRLSARLSGARATSAVALLAAPVRGSSRLRPSALAFALALEAAPARGMARLAPAIAASAVAVRPAPVSARWRLLAGLLSEASAFAVLGSPPYAASFLVDEFAASFLVDEFGATLQVVEYGATLEPDPNA